MSDTLSEEWSKGFHAGMWQYLLIEAARNKTEPELKGKAWPDVRQSMAFASIKGGRRAKPADPSTDANKVMHIPLFCFTVCKITLRTECSVFIVFGPLFDSGFCCFYNGMAILKLI